ncbi:MAG: hypothetical protein IJ542_01080 [Clostridia bacterium]|nr:hypothetical protein [Clostridia bacterium]
MYAKEDIEEFIVACDNMINSKFILVDKRIGEVLKSVATTKPVYNAIAENMINFNFNGAWTAATSKNGEIYVPEDKLIGFVFCMLKAINDGKININELLVKHFPSGDEKRSSYAIFCETTILPFKQQLIEKLCSEQKLAKPEKKSEQKTENLDLQISERLLFLAKDAKTYAAGLRRIKACPITKQEYLDLLNLLILAIDSGDHKYIKVLTQTLIALSGKDKELKQRLGGIIELIKE